MQVDIEGELHGLTSALSRMACALEDASTEREVWVRNAAVAMCASYLSSSNASAERLPVDKILVIANRIWSVTEGG